LSYQLATGPFSSSGNITIGHGDVPKHNNQIRVPGHPKWSQSRSLDHMDVSKTVQMSLKGRLKVDVSFGCLWFHFGLEMTETSKQFYQEFN